MMFAHHRRRFGWLSGDERDSTARDTHQHQQQQKKIDGSFRKNVTALTGDLVTVMYPLLDRPLDPKSSFLPATF